MLKPKHLTIMVHETGKPTVNPPEMVAESLNELIETAENLRGFIAKHCMDIKENSGSIRFEAMKAIDRAKESLKAIGYTE